MVWQHSVMETNAISRFEIQKIYELGQDLSFKIKLRDIDE